MRALWRGAFGIARAAVLPVGAFAAGLAFIALTTATSTATAQVSGQSTIVFEVRPTAENRVSIITQGANKGFLSYIGTTPATIIASVVGISGTYSGSPLTLTPETTLRALVLTIRALAQCSVRDGCDAFGLDEENTPAVRLHTFVTAGLSTISMYIAAGAELDDRVQIGGGQPNLFLLYHLATAAQTVKMSLLVSAGANVDAEDENGLTPLFWLITTTGDLPGARAFLSLGANVAHQDGQNRNALHLAALAQRGAIISLMGRAGTPLEAVDNSDRTPLFAALDSGGILAVTALLSLGANAGRGNRDGLTPLHIAAAKNDIGALEALVAADSANIDARDAARWTPLHAAVGARSADAVSILLREGASVNIRIYLRTAQGYSPVDLARLPTTDPNILNMLRAGGIPCSFDCSSGGGRPLPVRARVSITAAAGRNVSTTVGFLDLSGGHLAANQAYNFYVLPPYNGAVFFLRASITLPGRSLSESPTASVRRVSPIEDDWRFPIVSDLPRYSVVASISAPGSDRQNTVSIIVGDFCGAAPPGSNRPDNRPDCGPQITVAVVITSEAAQFNAAVGGNDRVHNVAAGRFSIIGTVSAAAASPDIFNFALDSDDFRGTIVKRADGGDTDVFYLIAALLTEGDRHDVVVTLNDNIDSYFAPTTVTWMAQAASSDEVILIGGDGNSNGAIYVSPANDLRNWTERARYQHFRDLRDHAVVNYNGTIVVVGGASGHGADFAVQSPGLHWSADRGRTWQSYDIPFDGGLQRFRVGLAVHDDGYLYVVGGRNASRYDDAAWRASDIRSAANWRRVAPPTNPDNNVVRPPALQSFRGTLISFADGETNNYNFANDKFYLADGGRWLWLGRTNYGGDSPRTYVGAALVSTGGRVVLYGPRVSHLGETPPENLHTHGVVYYYDGERDLNADGWAACTHRASPGTGAWASALAFRNSVYIFGGGSRQIQRYPADGCPASSSANDPQQQIPAAANQSQAVYMSDAKLLRPVPLPSAADFRVTAPFFSIPSGIGYNNEELFAFGVENRQPGSNYSFNLTGEEGTGFALRGDTLLMNRNIGGGDTGLLSATVRVFESGNIFQSGDNRRVIEQPFTVEVATGLNTYLGLRGGNLASVALVRGEWSRLSITVGGGFPHRGYNYTLAFSANAELDGHLYVRDDRILLSTGILKFYYREVELYARARDNYPENAVRMTLSVGSRSPLFQSRAAGRLQTVFTLPVVLPMSITVRSRQRQISLTAGVPPQNDNLFVVGGLSGHAPQGAGYAYSILSGLDKFTIGANRDGDGVVSLSSPLTNDDAGEYTLTVQIADRNIPPAREVVLFTAVVTTLQEFEAGLLRAEGVVPLNSPLPQFAGLGAPGGTISVSGGLPPYRFVSGSPEIFFATQGSEVSIFKVEAQRGERDGQNRALVNVGYTMVVSITVSDSAASTPDFEFSLTITAAPQVVLQNPVVQQPAEGLSAGMSRNLGGFRAHQAVGRDYWQAGENFVLPAGASLTAMVDNILVISAGAGGPNPAGAPYFITAQPRFRGVHTVIATISVANALFVPAFITTTLSVSPAPGQSGVEVVLIGGRPEEWRNDGNPHIYAGDINNIPAMTVRASNIMPSYARQSQLDYAVAQNGTIVVLRNRTNPPVVYWSPDVGHNWYSYRAPFAWQAVLLAHRGAIYALGGATGVNNRVWRSIDGQNWQRIAHAGNNNEYLGGDNGNTGITYHQAISFQGTMFVPGPNNRLYTSTDGARWGFESTFHGYPPDPRRYELVANHDSQWDGDRIPGWILLAPNSGTDRVYFRGSGTSQSDTERMRLCSQLLNNRALGPQGAPWSNRSAIAHGGTVYYFGDNNTQVLRWHARFCPWDLNDNRPSHRAPDPVNLPINTIETAMRAVVIDRESLPVYGEDFPLPMARISVLGSMTIANQSTLALSLAFYGGAAPYTLQAGGAGVSVISGINADLHFAVPQSGSEVREITLSISHGESINRQILTRIPLTVTITRQVDPFRARLAFAGGVVPLSGTSVTIGTVSITGGFGPYRYSSASGNLRFSDTDGQRGIFVIGPETGDRNGASRTLANAYTLTAAISVADNSPETPDAELTLTVIAAPQVILRQVSTEQSAGVSISAGASGGLGGFRAHQAAGRDYWQSGEDFVLPAGASLTVLAGNILAASAVGGPNAQGAPYSIIVQSPISGIHTVVATVSVANALFIPAFITATVSISPAAGRSGAEILLIGGRRFWSDGGNPHIWAGDINNLAAMTIRARDIMPHYERQNPGDYAVSRNGTVVVLRNNGNPPRVFWSPDAGHNWFSYPAPFARGAALVAHRGAVYALGGETGTDNRVWRSEDAQNWQRIAHAGNNSEYLGGDNGNAGIVLHNAASFRGTMVVPGGAGVYESTDGARWRLTPSSQAGNYPATPERYELLVLNDRYNGDRERMLMFGLRVRGTPNVHTHVYFNDDPYTVANFYNLCSARLPDNGLHNEEWPYRSAVSYGGTVYFFGNNTRNVRRWTGGCPWDIGEITREGQVVTPHPPIQVPFTFQSAVRAVLVERNSRPIYGDDFPPPQARISVVGSVTIANNATLALSLAFYDGAAPYTIQATGPVGVSVISGTHADLHFAIPQSGAEVREAVINITHGESINRQLQTNKTLTITIRRQ